jgi:uncharacterized membrane protein YeiH
MRDVVSTEIPVIFRPGELYALSSFAGAWVFLGSLYLGLSGFLAGTFAFLTVVSLRLASHAFGVKVPDPLWIRQDSGQTKPRI